MTALEAHYIYHDDGSTDTDIIAFNATQGQTDTIETIDLKNGADTYLTILDSIGAVVLDGSSAPITNDDRNDTCGSCINDALSYSSLINFSPATTDLYYVKVDTSPLLDAGSGRYGSYAINIAIQ